MKKILTLAVIGTLLTLAGCAHPGGCCSGKKGGCNKTCASNCNNG